MAKAFGYMGLAAALRAGRFLNLGDEYTTAPTSAVKGDITILFSTSAPRIAICTSTAAKTIKYLRFRTKSIASDTY